MDRSNKRLIFLILVCTVFPLYIYHNPANWRAISYHFTKIFYVFRPYPFWAHGRELLLVAWMWIVGYGLGAAIIRFLDCKAKGSPSPAYAVPLGWGILSFVIFFLAMAQILKPSIVLLVLVILTVGSVSYLLFQGNPLTSGWRQFFNFFQQCPWDARLALGLTAIPLGYAFFSALMPPTQSDGLRYHLTVPKLYLEHGGFVPIPDVAFSNFPFLIEYLYTIPLAFGLNSGPKLIHASFFLLSLGSIYHAAKRMGTHRTGVFAVLIYASIPCAPIFASWSFMEFGLTAYTLLAFAFGIRVVESIRAGDESTALRQAILTGIACGFLLGCKYTAMITCLFYGLMVLVPVFSLPRTLSFSNLSRTVVLTLVAVALFSPWLIKNYLLLGNPVYPFGRSLFPSPGWSDFNASFFSFHAGMKGNLNAMKLAPAWEWITDLLTLPFRVIFYPGDKAWHPDDFGKWPLGPIWAILVPLVLLHRSFTYRKTITMLFVVFLFFVWAFTYRDARFLLPCLAAAAPLCAVVVDELIALWPGTRAVLLLPVLYNLIFTTGSILLPTKNAPWWVVSGRISTEDYLGKVCDFTRSNYQAFAFLRDNTQSGEQVLLHGIETPFYCPNEFVGADWFNTDPLIRQSWETPDPDQLIKWLQDQDIRYIVYDFGKVRYSSYFQFYRLQRLPPDLGYPLLEELRSQERARLRYPLAYGEWRSRFIRKIQQAEAASPNVKALETLLDGLVLEEAFRYKEDFDPQTSYLDFPIDTVILKVPQKAN